MKTTIIIGAGILGSSTAYHLAKAGANVIVVDRKDPGQATDAAAGIICPWISQRRNKAWYTLAKNGAAYYEELIEQLESDGEKDTGYKRVGAISLHTDDNKLLKMKERAETRREDAPEIGDILMLTSKETIASFSLLSEEFKSVMISGGARVNGRALRQALENVARKHGAKFIDGSASISHDQTGLKGVIVDEDFYEADSIIITAGVWAEELLSPMGINIHVSAQKAQIVHLQLDDKNTGNWPVVMPPNDQYILAFDDGKVVVGATHEDNHHFDQRITAGGLQEVLNKALSIAPGLLDSTFVETRVGFRPFTPDFLPVIGEIPGFPGLLFANGLGASGLTVGPYLGAQLAKLALGKEVEIDLSLYDVSKAIRE
ncbi:MAG: FAD-binding oxidoreductase [Paenisporosarcina sp.]